MPFSFTESPSYLFTSESVTEGHPDKLCDQVSDAILDELMRLDPYSRVACETATTTNLVVLLGEITTSAKIDFEEIARETILSIGYDNNEIGLDGKKFAAVISESYQGWCAEFLPPDYAQELSKWCDENGILLIMDEIQSGFGRTGRLFTFEHFGIEPDIIACAKGISSSLPLSCVLTRKEINEELEYKTYF